LTNKLSQFVLLSSIASLFSVTAGLLLYDLVFKFSTSGPEQQLLFTFFIEICEDLSGTRFAVFLCRPCGGDGARQPFGVQCDNPEKRRRRPTVADQPALALQTMSIAPPRTANRQLISPGMSRARFMNTL
jgi:hypothetical protein